MLELSGHNEYSSLIACIVRSMLINDSPRNSPTTSKEKQHWIYLNFPQRYFNTSKSKMDCKLLMDRAHVEDDATYFQYIFKTFMEIYRVNI